MVHRSELIQGYQNRIRLDIKHRNWSGKKSIPDACHKKSDNRQILRNNCSKFTVYFWPFPPFLCTNSGLNSGAACHTMAWMETFDRLCKNCLCDRHAAITWACKIEVCKIVRCCLSGYFELHKNCEVLAPEKSTLMILLQWNHDVSLQWLGSRG